MGHPNEEALVRYLAKECGSAERAHVEWHLDQCSVCAETITAMDMVRAARHVRLRGEPTRRRRKHAVDIEHISRSEIARWSSGSCSVAERRAVESHLCFCPACKKRYTATALLAIAAEARHERIIAARSA